MKGHFLVIAEDNAVNNRENISLWQRDTVCTEHHWGFSIGEEKITYSTLLEVIMEVLTLAKDETILASLI